jgi:hypothetical protein
MGVKEAAAVAVADILPARAKGVPHVGARARVTIVR